MDIVKTAKEIGSDVEKGVESIANKVADTFDNLASHLPFSNIAKKEDSSFHLEVDLPGVEKEDIDIKVEDNTLILSAIRHYKNELTRDNYYLCESSFGKFERVFSLPKNIDSENITASSQDGVLEVVIPKQDKAASKKRIKIK